MPKLLKTYEEYSYYRPEEKIELLTMLACFVVANLANLYAIISYDTPFSEMLTSIFYVLAFSCVLYAFWTLLRVLFYGICRLFLKKEK